MPWFQKLCRNTGLMIHHVVKPVKNTRRIDNTVKEKKLNENVTLRRTTIDEIEIKNPEPDSRP